MLNTITEHFNALISICDRSNEWEDFTVDKKTVCEITEEAVYFEYIFKTKGGIKNLARKEFTQLTFIL